jgi:solute carrier family 34 (sodium-dependent phosphate cotransporter)
MNDRARGWTLGVMKALGFMLALNVFFVAIKLLGAFKSLGSGYGETLILDLAQNPLMGLLVGILVTSIIQSSSTTTSIVVGLVAAGVLGQDPVEAMRLAIPIIMGANIGTSITATLVSLGQASHRAEFSRAYGAAVVHDAFNWLTVLVLFPLQVATNFLGHGALFLANALQGVGGLKFTSPIKYLVGPQTKLIHGTFDGSEPLVRFVVVLFLAWALFSATTWLAKRVRDEKRTGLFVLAISVGVAGVATFVQHFSEHVFHATTAIFLTGLALLFVALATIVGIMRSVVLDRVQRVFDAYIFRTGIRALLLGLVLTALVQSSSVTISLVVPLAGAGLLSLRQLLPYTMGANVGTTVTAILAALSLGEVLGVSVAFAHLLFNICGISLFWPLQRVPLWVATKLGALAGRHIAYPVAIIFTAYLGLPILAIVLFH